MVPWESASPLWMTDSQVFGWRWILVNGVVNGSQLNFYRALKEKVLYKSYYIQKFYIYCRFYILKTKIY